jgi:hypothetical protein
MDDLSHFAGNTPLDVNQLWARLSCADSARSISMDLDSIGHRLDDVRRAVSDVEKEIRGTARFSTEVLVKHILPLIVIASVVALTLIIGLIHFW